MSKRWSQAIVVFLLTLGVSAPAQDKENLETLLQSFIKSLQEHKDILTVRESTLSWRFLEKLERADMKLAQKAYHDIGTLLAVAKDTETADAGRLMIGISRRMGLIGQRMDVKGKTLDGEEFELAQWKGKVVLVDFWATWCGPCLRELPNVRKLYDQYHARGFEVIVISRDRVKQQLTKFVQKEKVPWPFIYDRDRPQNQQLAEYYGVYAVPVVILVGRDGRVLSTQARGDELERLLAEQFPEKR